MNVVLRLKGENRSSEPVRQASEDHTSLDRSRLLHTLLVYIWLGQVARSCPIPGRHDKLVGRLRCIVARNGR
jgi:hypothetical protein